jgi:hypothetical protein
MLIAIVVSVGAVLLLLLLFCVGYRLNKQRRLESEAVLHDWVHSSNDKDSSGSEIKVFKKYSVRNNRPESFDRLYDVKKEATQAADMAEYHLSMKKYQTYLKAPKPGTVAGVGEAESKEGLRADSITDSFSGSINGNSSGIL